MSSLPGPEEHGIFPPAPESPRTGVRFWLARVEDSVVVLTLAAIVLIPLVEAVLRKAFHTSLPGSVVIVPHLVLLVGMIGGVIAARENRLLALSSVIVWLKGKAKERVAVFGGGVALAVTAFLAFAAYEFVKAEKMAPSTFVGSIRLWVVQLLLPVGFALIALHVWWRAAATWRGRLVVLLLAGGLAALPVFAPWDRSQMLLPLLGLLLAGTIAGAPIYVLLGGAAMILFWSEDLPIASIALDHYRQVTNAALPTLPLFTLAGYFLAEGGASRRLIRVLQALVGGIRGGPALVTALVCAFFTCFTGASGVTILALGGLLMPVLIAARYSERNALGLLTGAGSLGLLFPPCLPLILYAIVASVPIKEMFLGGILPGFLLVGLAAAWGVYQAPADASSRRKFDGREALAAIWDAKWELMLPVVALVGLLSGLATPVEAAALTAFYAFAIEAWIYRDLKVLKDAPRVMTECGLLIGGILLILGVALGLTNYLIDAQIPARAVEWATGAVGSRWVFLILLNVFLLIVGCLMDIFSAIVVVVPLIVPLGEAFQIHPIHLGIIFLANLELGYLTPPVGMNLFLSSYRFDRPMSEVIRSTLPMLFVLLIGVLLITYIPILSTFLPDATGR